MEPIFGETKYGLNVLYDGDGYIVVDENIEKEYVVGSLICEYFRLDPKTVKNRILRVCSDNDDVHDNENMMKVFDNFSKVCNHEYEPVIARMICTEFFDKAITYYDLHREGKSDVFFEEFEIFNDIENQKIVFEGTKYTGPGDDSSLQLFLSLYIIFIHWYSLVRMIFDDLANNEEASHEQLLSFYDENYGIQNIDYRILLTKKGFKSLYIIGSSLSLLLFETAHIIQKDTQMVKCKNCGKYFVPKGRKDAVYCDYTIYPRGAKTCKDVGAQNARAEKEKNDIVTKEYRRVYMKLRMQAKRHSKNKEYMNKFENLKSGMMKWKDTLDKNPDATKDFLEWLKKFEEGGAE